jgi:RimJ/RimL family protein N-acetyltransferase
MDDGFARGRPDALDRRRRNACDHIYVNYGFTNPTHLVEVARQALEILGLADRAVVTAGAEIGDVIREMTRADVALGAAGTSSWERCSLGLPSVASIAADNQKPNAAALAAGGAATVLPPERLRDAGAVAAALGDLVDHADRRHAMARRAAALCDGLGARRIAIEAAEPHLSRDGTEVRLRPATKLDGETMLRWQQHPKARVHARTPEPPNRASHFQWLRERLDDPDCYFNIVLHGDRPAGVVRLERFAGTCYEVSILIEPELHGAGIGHAALDLARALIPWGEFHAVVLPGNAASHALFRGAGYEARHDRYVSPPLQDVALN